LGEDSLLERVTAAAEEIVAWAAAEGLVRETFPVERGGEGSSMRKRHAAEALACIAFKQPISQAETEPPFVADNSRLLVKLRDLKLVEEFAGSDGRLHSCQRFGARKLAGIECEFWIASMTACW
jgi:hypothetical protein